ncbi:TetR family transcriptional regulator C-terminal domain-containing protein [Nocardioides sp. cx-169]|uniref:TetR family transcriptional regulator C-terminal domain-containing protein n=1 Tax=Nocardioides sp. cx-169 TaxID=2899080 RepID=UPI0035A917C4
MSTPPSRSSAVAASSCTAAEEGAAALVPGPENEARDRIRTWLAAPVAGPDPRGCLLARGTAELAWENDAIAARSHAAFESLFASCRQLVEQAQAAGHIDAHADAAVLGGLIVATHRGLEALAKAGVDPATLQHIATAAVDSFARNPTSVQTRRSARSV